ncbi:MULTISPECIES: hypothetical protein [Pseudoalteromonas]|nr:MULTISPECIES: hypothetical protein [Pseudoalteromonas]KZN43351.1 hypothetical protein N483_08640 [Pseudoalteromonas luteoviolacea NCIMB 1944]
MSKQTGLSEQARLARSWLIWGEKKLEGKKFGNVAYLLHCQLCI